MLTCLGLEMSSGIFLVCELTGFVNHDLIQFPIYTAMVQFLPPGNKAISFATTDLAVEMKLCREV